MNIRKELLNNVDDKYKAYMANVINNIDPKMFLGVRAPIAKDIAKKALIEGKYQKFLEDLPHKNFEEYYVHDYILCGIKDFDECIYYVDKYLPYIDNWAICDSLKPKALKKNKKELYKKINVWIKSKHTYTVRFAIECLMTYFLDDDFDPKHIEQVRKIKSDEYYINMMRAWYFATCMIKHKDEVVKLLESKKIDIWTHNKAIQKAIESYRISDSDKKYLRTLKINEKRK